MYTVHTMRRNFSLILGMVLGGTCVWRRNADIPDSHVSGEGFCRNQTSLSLSVNHARGNIWTPPRKWPNSSMSFTSRPVALVSRRQTQNSCVFFRRMMIHSYITIHFTSPVSTLQKKRSWGLAPLCRYRINLSAFVCLYIGQPKIRYQTLQLTNNNNT